MRIVSLKTELATLRAMCHRDESIASVVITGTDESYFHSTESKEIYNACRRVFLDTGKAPAYRLVLEDPELSTESRQHFRDSTAVIGSKTEAMKAVRILNKYRQTRGLYMLAAHIGETIKKTKVNVDDLMGEVIDTISNIQASKINNNLFTHFGKSSNSSELVKNMLYADQQEHVIPTGVRDFDKEAGGFMRGSLVTLGATSGGGKSLLSNWLAMNQASMGYNVVVVPLEMSREEQAARVLANVSGIDVTRCLNNKRLSENEKALIYTKYKRWSLKVKNAGGRLSVFKPDRDMNIEEILTSVQTYGADVRYIDYVSLLKGMDGDDQWRALGAAGRYSKINAEVSNCVNVLLCQVSEDLKIRYARALSEHSSNSWLWVTPKAEREKDIGIIQIEQPKGRNNKVYPIRFGLEWAKMRGVNLDDQTTEAPEADADRQRKALPNLAQADI